MQSKITSSHSRSIIILGMHRSGTSALTRVLNLLGVNLGTQLLPQHATNKTGFWEHSTVIRINEQILQKINSSWFDTAPLPQQWWKSAVLTPLRQHLSEVLAQEFASQPFWGIKDPRLCRLLPLWIPLLQKLENTPHFVIIARHPLEVATSLAIRDGLSVNISLRLWLEYVLTSVQDSQAYPRVFVTYEELLQDWVATMAKIAQNLKITWPNSLELVSREIDRFLDPTLKHHNHSQKNSQFWQSSVVNEELLTWSHAVYQALCQAATGNYEPLSILNPIQASLHGSSQIQHPSATPYLHLLIHLRKSQQQWLTNTLAALRSQSYNHWYLSIIADFNSTDSSWQEFPNIRWLPVQSQDQVTETINHEIAIIKADWVALITAGDCFASNLLSLCVQFINNSSNWQFIYVDEDSLSTEGKYYDPKFKPDFNLDLLRSMPYLGHFNLIRREAQQIVGGYAPYHGWENYDIALKILEKYGETAFGHLPQLLYHHLETRSQFNPLSIFTADKTGRKILQQHLERQNISAQVQSTSVKNIYWINYALQHYALISIIIATRNGSSSLQRCINSVLKITQYNNYEILVIDNHSDDPDTLTYLATLTENSVSSRSWSWNHEASPAEINNFAAQQARGEYLLFLNDDTEVIQADWLQRLLAYNQRPEIGMVAPRLLDSQQRLLQAGLILGLGKVGIAGQIHQGLTVNELGYMERAQATQNFSAVSDHCLMIKQSVYREISERDTDPGTQLFNEIELCLKVKAAGYKIVWTPQVTLIQHGFGSLIRNRQTKIDNNQLNQEITFMYERWLPQLSHDPAYNPNLCLNNQEWQPETQINVPWNGLLAQKPRIIAFPYDNWGCGEYRVRAPLRGLQHAGWLEYALMPNDNVGKVPTLTELERMQADTVLLHNSLHDEHLDALQHYRRLSRYFKVFGQDDLIYALPKTNPYYQTNYKDIKNRVYRAISLCDRLIVTTEPLAEAYHHLNRDIQIIPNYIESARWAKLSPQRRQSRKRKPRVGWAGAAQHQGDLKLIVSLIKALASEVEWVFFGLCPVELQGYLHEYHDMVPFEQYPAKLASLNLDLAIVPLETNAFNEAKSNLRLLEQGILGYPIVCSDIYPYQNAPVTRVANNERAWLEAIQERINDLDAAAKEGDILKQWVIDHWLLEDHLSEWGPALNVMATTDSIKFVKPQRSEPRLIVILGCEHSGTHLLARILCQHEFIDEFAPDFAPSIGNLQIPALWTEKEALVRLSDQNAKIATIFNKTKSKVWLTKLSYLVVEGLPANMGRALWLQQHFPEAYFIHVIRNGYAVALDIHEQVQQEHGTTPLLLHRATRQWRRSLEILQEEASQLHNFFELRYEELLENPITVIHDLFKFLQLKPPAVDILESEYKFQEIAEQETAHLAQMTPEQRAVIKNGLAKVLL